MSTKEVRQAEYLRIVEETGSPVQARRRLGLTSRTIGSWRADPDFVERLQDAVDVANDAIRAKVRSLALEGDTSMLALSMKVIEPALRPSSAVNVAVGVRTGGPDLAKLDDAALIERANQILADVQMRQQALLPDVVDAEVVQASPAGTEAAIGVEEGAEHVEDLQAPNEPRLEDLL